MAGMTSLWLAAALAGAPAAAPAPAGPLRLVTEPSGNGIRISVVGESAVSCEAQYLLTVSTKLATGSNNSVQRGAASLRPGVVTVVATVTLGNAGSWSARLRVEPCGTTKGYEETKAS